MEPTRPKLPSEAVELYNLFIHGVISRRAFMDGVQKFAAGGLAATAILIFGYFLFGIEVKGNIVLLYAAIFTIILGALGQGLLISTITDSQQVAFLISVFSSLLPSFLLSGFVFPISTMPVALQVLSNLAVNKFFLVVVRGVMLKGVGFAAVWDQFVWMILFAVITLGVSTVRMHKRTA